MWSMLLDFLRIVGDAVNFLLAMLFLALIVWGGEMSIHINGFSEFLKRWA